MFCMGCGTEAPFGAARCAVCGHDLGGSNNGDARRAAGVPAPVGTLPTPSSFASAFSPPRAGLPAPATIVAGAGSAIAGPNMPGLPRDAPGRVVLATVIAMAADLLVPWAVVNGEHRAAAAFGGLALLALPVLAAALLPLFNPALRGKPLYAALPLIVGALCVGAGCTLWAALTYLSYKLAFVPLAGSGDVSSPGGSFLSLSPDAGIYLFILGGAVLAFSGYHLFLAAATLARREAVPAARPSAAVPLLPPPAAPALPLPPYRQAQTGMAASPAPASIPLATSVPLPSSAVWGSANGVLATSATPIMAQAMPSLDRASVPVPTVPAAADKTQHNGAEAMPGNDSLHVPLPGSAAWNEAPRQAEHVRPALGWQRGPRVRR